MERWRRVLDGLYEVSDLGRVRRIGSASGTQEGKVLAPITTTATGGKYPYLSVNLSHRGVVKRYKIHMLVAHAFLGPRPDGRQINHKDGNSFNNNVENLEYVTPKENMKHASVNNLLVCGEDHTCAKITETQVEEIRHKYYAERATIRQLCSEYGLSVGTVHPLVQFKTWKHVPSRYAHFAKEQYFGARKKGKVTEWDVVQIRKLHAEGMTLAKLQEQFGVNQSTLHSIVHRKTWKHVK